jgi:hypothetical protein
MHFTIKGGGGAYAYSKLVHVSDTGNNEGWGLSYQV